jgi:hypothetical protein
MLVWNKEGEGMILLAHELNFAGSEKILTGFRRIEI